MARAESDHWRSASLDVDQERMMADSVTPVRDLTIPVDVTAPVEITDGVTLVPTPGHTPGHCSVLVESDGASAMITGDALHHPVQIAHPCIGCGADVDGALADRTRRALLDRVADTDTLVVGTHFTAPIAGWVRRHEEGLRLVPDTRDQRAG
ncbi:MAG: MBL fold metallo-hydrolase [Gordonia paraffinivorans]